MLTNAICFIKGHLIKRLEVEIHNPNCLRCGKIFDHKELIKEYKKFLKKEYVNFMKTKKE